MSGDISTPGVCVRVPPIDGGDVLAREVAGLLRCPQLGIDETSVFEIELQWRDRWCVVQTAHNVAVEIDFESAPYQRRIEQHSIASDRLVRAVTGRRDRAEALTVFDATAGIGRDALVLAAAGCRLTLVEQHPLVAFLLRQALEQARESSRERLCEAAGRMTLREGNSCDVMAQWSGAAPDVIYLDPMFEFPRGSAAAKKELALLQRITSSDVLEQENRTLFDAALRLAKKRVIVKRTPGKDYLANAAPSHVLESKTVRFDVYQLG